MYIVFVVSVFVVDINCQCNRIHFLIVVSSMLLIVT